MRQYSIDRVELTWQGLDFKPGLAAGSSIVEARTTASFSDKTSAMGELIRVYSADKSGTLTILVNQESQLHQDLKALSAADRLNRNIVGAMVMKDTSSGEQYTYKNSYIQTDPDETRGTESTDVSWNFRFESIEKSVSANQNLVGN